MGMNRLDPGFFGVFFVPRPFEDFSAFKGLIEDDFLKRDASCI